MTNVAAGFHVFFLLGDIAFSGKNYLFILVRYEFKVS